MELFTPGHIIPLLIVIAVLYFGGSKLPEISRSVGRSLRVFKTELKGLAEDDKARDEAGRTTSDDGSAAPVEIRKAIEAPAAEQTPHVVATPSGPIPVQAEVVRPARAAQPGQGARPRPRPAGSAARQ